MSSLRIAGVITLDIRYSSRWTRRALSATPLIRHISHDPRTLWQAQWAGRCWAPRRARYAAAAARDRIDTIMLVRDRRLDRGCRRRSSFVWGGVARVDPIPVRRRAHAPARFTIARCRLLSCLTGGGADRLGARSSEDALGTAMTRQLFQGASTTAGGSNGVPIRRECPAASRSRLLRLRLLSSAAPVPRYRSGVSSRTRQISQSCLIIVES